MNKELDNLVFSTKSIMITDKQRDLISDLIDQLNDMDICDYDSIEYWKLSKQDAAKLIGKLIDEIDGYRFAEYYDYEDITLEYGDRD